MDVTQDYAIVVKDGRARALAFDTVVLSLGTRVDAEAINQLRSCGGRVLCRGKQQWEVRHRVECHHQRF